MWDKLTNWANSALEKATKANLESFLSLETADPTSGIFVARDGSLASVIRVDGMRKMMGRQEMEEITTAATDALHPFMIGPGHAIQVCFLRDPELSRHMLTGMLRPAVDVARALKLEMTDVFDERRRVLPNFLVHESFHLVLWTRPSIFTKREMERIKVDMATPPFWPRSMDTGDIFKAASQIRVRHASFASSFISEMGRFGLRMVVAEAHDAMATMRASIFPELSVNEWKPWLAGDEGKDERGRPRMPPARIGVTRERKGDMAHLLWPRLRDHMFPLHGQVVNSTTVKLGRTLMAGVDVTIGPQQIMAFQSLLDSFIASGEFPWRVSFLIEADGASRLGMKSFLAAMASITGGGNPLIRDSIKALQARKTEGESIVKLRTSFATWDTAGDPRVIEERSGKLLKIVETWGLQTASQSAGDPMDGVLSSAIGLRVGSTAPAGAEPLRDVMARLPWMRDASPYANGSVLFRTFDGRPWPYQPGSTVHQDTSVDFIYAPPGKGKSVWLNTTNLAFCLNAAATSGTGGARLPRVAIIDVGVSSSGVISLLRESLPPEQRHQVLYKKLAMVKEDSINPFDTQLGFRNPLPLERSFLVNFISLLGTEPGRASPPDGLIDMCGMIVDEIYELFSDQGRTGGEPKGYVAYIDETVDAAIKQAGITIEKDTTWWYITDELFARIPGAEGVRLASLAQRYAVPILQDLPAMAGSPKVADIFGRATVPGSNESLIDMFKRCIMSSLRSYPILVYPTQLDLGDARVVSLDLNDVAQGSGSAMDVKQTAIVYMLARYVLAKDFYLSTDESKMAPPDYRDHHLARITRIRETPKRLIFDEFHRTKGATGVRQQVIVDMREGRKYGVQIALASQMLDDFDDEMLGLGSGFWIMGCGNEQDRENTRKRFGLGETAGASLSLLNGPLPGGRGAPFLAVLNMRDGTHEHLLINTLGPIEMWAFSTTPDDVALRNRMYALVGPAEARKRLAFAFKGGSAVAEITRRKEEMSQNSRMSLEQQKGIVAKLAEELSVATQG